MHMNDVGKMAENMVFATVINNGGNNQANTPLQTLVMTVRVPAACTRSRSQVVLHVAQQL